MDWVGRFHDGLVNQFLATYQQVPHFHGESDRVNRDVLEYIRALANWVRASDCWAFEVMIRCSSELRLDTKLTF